MSQVRILSPRPRIRRYESFGAPRWPWARVTTGRITPGGLDRTARVFNRQLVAMRAESSVASTPVGRPRRVRPVPGRIILSPRPLILKGFSPAYNSSGSLASVGWVTGWVTSSNGVPVPEMWAFMFGDALLPAFSETIPARRMFIKRRSSVRRLPRRHARAAYGAPLQQSESQAAKLSEAAVCHL
jgi:hypothetical protein